VIENTHNRGGGNAIKLDEINTMTDVACQHGLSVHLDGARIFNAAVALGVDAREIAKFADTVQFCLSKALSAPIGSMVAGSEELIKRAAYFRKIVGGDLRQSGVLAAAGIVALEKMVDRLAEDHSNAALLTRDLKEIPRISVDIPPNPTNMVFINTDELDIDGAQFVNKLREQGVLAVVYGPTRVRFVTHRHIDEEGIQRATEAVERIVSEM